MKKRKKRANGVYIKSYKVIILEAAFMASDPFEGERPTKNRLETEPNKKRDIKKQTNVKRYKG